MLVEFSLADKTFLKSFAQNLEYSTTLEVCSVKNSIDSSRERTVVGSVLIAVVEVVDGITVGQDDTIETPLLAQDVDEQTFAFATRFTFVAVVCTHHLAYITFLYKSLECRKIGLPEVAHRYTSIKAVTLWLWTAMYGIVLSTCVGLVVLLVVTLHTEYSLHTKYCIQIWVLTASLLTTSPTWVTEDVYVWTPIGQFWVAWYMVGSHCYIEDRSRAVPVGTGFIRYL